MEVGDDVHMQVGDAVDGPVEACEDTGHVTTTGTEDTQANFLHLLH